MEMQAKQHYLNHKNRRNVAATRCLWVFFAFFAVCGYLGQARAEELLAMPELSKTFDLTAYATNTDTIRKVLESTPDSGFEVALPKTWTERSTLGQDYGELSRFIGPAVGDVRPYFSLKRKQVKREITAKNEFVSYLLSERFVLRAIRVIDSRNVEALYVVHQASGESYVVRGRLRLNGSSFVLGEYAVPVAAWNTMRDQQTFAMASFKYLQDVDTKIEKRRDYNFRQTVKFAYPESWVLQEETKITDNQVLVRLANPGPMNASMGAIRITVLGDFSLLALEDLTQYPLPLKEMIAEVKTRYEMQGYIVGQATVKETAKVDIPTLFNVREIYQLRPRLTQFETTKQANVSHELWLSVFKTKESRPRVVIAELFTPARTEDLYLWAVNTQALEIIVQSFR